MIIIRELQNEDAENLLNLLNKLDTETTFLLYERGERKTTIEQQRKNIQEQLEKGVLTFRGGGENPRDFFPIDSFVEELVDGVGAGDALLAASTLSLITSKNILISSIIGNIAASLVCELHGNQTIDLNLLKKRLFEIKKHLS